MENGVRPVGIARGVADSARRMSGRSGYVGTASVKGDKGNRIVGTGEMDQWMNGETKNPNEVTESVKLSSAERRGS